MRRRPNMGARGSRAGGHAAAGRDARRQLPSSRARPRLAFRLRPDRADRRNHRHPPQPPAVSDHPQVSHAGVLHADRPARRGGAMALILDFVLQGVQMALVVAIAPLILGVTRKVKARLLRRVGPPLLQPYLDLWKLMHKEAVLAYNAS